MLESSFQLYASVQECQIYEQYDHHERIWVQRSLPLHQISGIIKDVRTDKYIFTEIPLLKIHT